MVILFVHFGMVNAGRQVTKKILGNNNLPGQIQRLEVRALEGAP